MFQNMLPLLPPHFREELLSLTKVKYLVQSHLDNKVQLCSNPSSRREERGGAKEC